MKGNAMAYRMASTRLSYIGEEIKQTNISLVLFLNGNNQVYFARKGKLAW
jgi:hypothetical protein